jgi:hypothetical protein
VQLDGCRVEIPGVRAALVGGDGHHRSPPAHPSSSRLRHRGARQDCMSGNISGRCGLGGHCTASYDLIKIVLRQHPFPANFAARKPTSTELVSKPFRRAAEKDSSLIEGEKKQCCGGHRRGTPAERKGPLALNGRCLLSLPCSRRSRLERLSNAPLPIQRPKHASILSAITGQRSPSGFDHHGGVVLSPCVAR